MIETGGGARFRAEPRPVVETPGGLTAQVEGERLRIDLVRMSWCASRSAGAGSLTRHRPSPCAPTRAPTPAEFTVGAGPDACARLLLGLVVTLWPDPFRLDAHRADGSVIFETAQDDERPLLDLRDAQR